jgi:predicted amidohydrolase
MPVVRAAVVQMEHAAGDKGANFAKLEAMVRRAANEQLELIVFPECCLTGYWYLRKLSREQLRDLAEAVPEGPSTIRLLELAQHYNMTIGAGLIEAGGEQLFNTYVIALPDGRHYRHRKIQAFEHESISAGDQYTVFDLPNGVRVGILICYDNNILENVRITALAGAEILLAPHQTGGCNSVSPHGMKNIDPAVWHNREREPEAARAALNGDNGRGWLMRWLPSRAHDNGLFVLFANGIGVDDDEIRTGNAMILDPYGRIVNEATQLGDEMVVAELELSLVPQSTGRRWLKSRRPELYGPLCVPTGQEKETRLVRFGVDL